MKFRKSKKGVQLNVIASVICLMFLFVFFVQATQAQAVSKKEGKTPFRIPKVEKKIHLDGVLDENVWKNALILELKYEVLPGENIDPPVKTEVLLAYNRTHLLVAFRAYDPDPAKIRARVTDRDNFVGDDYIGVVLDTFNDNRRYYHFLCNPFGIQADLIENTDGGGDEWDGIWKSAGKITDWGYAVEMSIPFSSLRFQHNKEEQIWSIDAIRKYSRNVLHHISLFPQDRNNNCYMCQSEKIIGFKGVSQEKNLEIDPTLSGKLTQNRESFPDGKFVKKDSKIEPGITARWSFTPNLTLSATANPDFSNVEADSAQLDINTQFALYYPEKRPFFLEGSTIFNTLFNVIYTRTLVDPNGGIKLTGKEGVHGMGFFSVHDNITNLLIPGSQGSYWTSLDTNTLGTGLRYRRDIGQASNLGVIVSDREGEEYYNRVAGLDGSFRLTRKDWVSFQLLGSQTRYPDHITTEYEQPSDDFTGGAVDFSYQHTTRTFNWTLTYQDVSPNFRADLGFVPQVGFRYINGIFYHPWRRKPGSWYTLFSLGTSFQEEEDYDGNRLYRTFTLFLRYGGPAQSYFNFDLSTGEKSYMGMMFGNNYITMKTGFKVSKTLAFRLTGRYGDQIDFTNAQLGTLFAISPEMELKLGAHLYAYLDHDYEKLDVEGGRLYTANLTNMKLVYQFNKRTLLRSILQFANFRYDPDLYPTPRNPKYQHLFSQFLFSYKINPQTVLFLGYSDDYYGYQGIILTQNNRTFFLKVGYALQL